MYRRRRGRRAWPVVVSQSDVGVKSTNAYGDAHGAEAAAERQGWWVCAKNSECGGHGGMHVVSARRAFTTEGSCA